MAIDLLIALPIALAMERILKLWLFVQEPGTLEHLPSRLFTATPDARLLLACIAIAFVLYRALAEADGAGLGRSLVGLELDCGPHRPGLWRSFVRAIVPWRGIDRLLGLRVIHADSRRLRDRIRARAGMNAVVACVVAAAITAFVTLEGAVADEVSAVRGQTRSERLSFALARYDCCKLGRLDDDEREACDLPIREGAALTTPIAVMMDAAEVLRCDRMLAVRVFNTAELDHPLDESIVEALSASDVELRDRARNALVEPQFEGSEVITQGLMHALAGNDGFAARAAYLLADRELRPEEVDAALRPLVPRLLAEQEDRELAAFVDLAVKQHVADVFTGAQLESLLDRPWLTIPALEALGQLGPAAAASIPAIERLIAGDERRGPYWAHVSLPFMGIAARPALERILTDQAELSFALFIIEREEQGIGTSYGRSTRAAIAAVRGETSEARQSIDALLAHDPNDPRALFLLTCVELESGALDRARAAVARLEAARPRALAIFQLLRALIAEREKDPRGSWIESAGAARRAAKSFLFLPEPVKAARVVSVRALEESTRRWIDLVQTREGNRLAFNASEWAVHAPSVEEKLAGASIIAAALDPGRRGDEDRFYYDDYNFPEFRAEMPAVLTRVLEQLRAVYPNDLLLALWSLEVAHLSPADALASLERIARLEPKPMPRGLVYAAVKRAYLSVDPAQAHERALLEARRSKLRFGGHFVEQLRDLESLSGEERARSVNALKIIGEKLDATSPSQAMTGVVLAMYAARIAGDEVVRAKLMERFADLPDVIGIQALLELPIPSLNHELADLVAVDDPALARAFPRQDR